MRWKPDEHVAITSSSARRCEMTEPLVNRCYHDWEWETWAAPTSSMGQTSWIFVVSWSKSAMSIQDSNVNEMLYCNISNTKRSM